MKPKELIPKIHQFVPHGVSLNSVDQFVQHVQQGSKGLKTFHRDDDQPPKAYDLRRVTAPVVIFWGQNDLLATEEDVDWLASNLGNCRASIRVPDPKFNHFDFLLGRNAYHVLYSHIIRLLPRPY